MAVDGGLGGAQLEGLNDPLFSEYVEHCAAAGWGERFSLDKFELGPSDALIVVDMQNDFVPQNEQNNCGAFAVAEGDSISPLIEMLMNTFAEKGGLVVATRDYHPCDHCSFLGHGGHFPPHCVQGSPGSKFYPPIGKTLRGLMDKKKRAEIVFKGYHENIDSFGSFEYPDDEGTLQRVSSRREDDDKKLLHGCSLTAWTGAVCLKCSSLPSDINAPPDVLSIHRSDSLADRLKAEGIRRIFACGLAMDFCVLDTTRNAIKKGFPDAFLIMDAARAAHVPGLGLVGSGFLQEPSDLLKFMQEDGVRLIPSCSVLDTPTRPALTKVPTPASFPKALSPFALVEVADCTLMADFDALRYVVSQPETAIHSLGFFGVQPTGKLTAPVQITLSTEHRARAGIPSEAETFCWANPLESIGNLHRTAMSYFSTLSKATAFMTFGGFLYLNASGAICHTTVVAPGTDISFGDPQLWRPEYTAAIASRAHKVTLPSLTRNGATFFAWLHAGETLEPAGIEAWVPAKNGAFLYFFGSSLEQADPRDVFFAVED